LKDEASADRWGSNLIIKITEKGGESITLKSEKKGEEARGRGEESKGGCRTLGDRLGKRRRLLNGGKKARPSQKRIRKLARRTLDD